MDSMGLDSQFGLIFTQKNGSTDNILQSIVYVGLVGLWTTPNADGLQEEIRGQPITPGTCKYEPAAP